MMLCTALLSFNSLAKDTRSNTSMSSVSSFFEVGVGVEYGGLGTQFHLPKLFDNVDIFLAAGVFFYFTRTGEEFGFGSGFNYYLEDHHSINFYYGILNHERHVNDNLDIEVDSDYGFSLGYKYYFNGRRKSGFTLGATYNLYYGDAYPSLSLAYRF